MASAGEIPISVGVVLRQPKITWNTPYRPEPVWPDGWPVPRVGDEVAVDDGNSLRVATVVWFPKGENEGDEPFVYVVLR